MRRFGVGILTVVAVLVAPGPASARRAPVLAGRCIALSAAGHATRLFFKATGPSTFMLERPGGTLLNDGTAAPGFDPGPAAEFAVRRSGRGVVLHATANGRALAAGAQGALAVRDGAATRFGVRRARSGCRRFPEAELDAHGTPARGTRRDGSVIGIADSHLHITADLRGGGRVISGAPFDRFGITLALGRDGDVHGPDGALDITGNLLRGGVPVGTHDTHGWPSFSGWPTHDTNTHQQIYYRWLQRAWMGGLRLVVAQLVEDQPLCAIEPLRSHSCDETATIELEARELRGLQDYVDAQSGGPGRGWLRIVRTPAQARRVIASGRLAVVQGVESSDPFDCAERLGATDCDRRAVDAGIALYRRLGVRAMFLAHWVDNAFGGAALEGGDKGTFISAFQVAQTGLPFATGACPEPSEGEELGPLPGKRCNTRGLTDLGRYLVERLMDAHMLIEADHLSEQTRLDVLALAEARHYPLVSSHNGTGGLWTPSLLRRLQALGGFVATPLDDAGALASRVGALGGYGFAGVGLGSDTGGFASLPGPDPHAGDDPLQYPFRAPVGRVMLGRQRTGTRTFDVNTDGVAHYGLLPDLLANVRRSPGGPRALRLLSRSAEAYLDTWSLALSRPSRR